MIYIVYALTGFVENNQFLVKVGVGGRSNQVYVRTAGELRYK